MNADHYLIARDYPGLSSAQALVALLSETLETANSIARAKRDLRAVGDDEAKLAKVRALTGSVGQIQDAERAANATLEEILSRVTVRDLQEGRDAMRLTEGQFKQAMMTRDLMDFERRRQRERGQDLDR